MACDLLSTVNIVGRQLADPEDDYMGAAAFMTTRQADFGLEEGATWANYYAEGSADAERNDWFGTLLDGATVEGACDVLATTGLIDSPVQQGVSLAFNREVMTAVEIELGGFLGTTPIIGLKRMDNGEGIVKIAMARRGETSAPSPPGILATIQFKVSDSAKSGTYELEVTKVGLADESFQDITEFTVQGASLKISS